MAATQRDASSRTSQWSGSSPPPSFLATTNVRAAGTSWCRWNSTPAPGFIDNERMNVATYLNCSQGLAVLCASAASLEANAARCGANGLKPASLLKDRKTSRRRASSHLPCIASSTALIYNSCSRLSGGVLSSFVFESSRASLPSTASHDRARAASGGAATNARCLASASTASKSSSFGSSVAEPFKVATRLRRGWPSTRSSPKLSRASFRSSPDNLLPRLLRQRCAAASRIVRSLLSTATATASAQSGSSAIGGLAASSCGAAPRQTAAAQACTRRVASVSASSEAMATRLGRAASE
mmetsp:Transcript_11485/g.30000  ORF Transcript_11485/g.30000 Transcript_11485/m.30000 type:complete len:298 (-) Transcript_11485:160-1053(-)